MKNFLIIAAMTATLATTSASAFWNNNNYGWNSDNGIFAYNPYSFFDPRWYFKEANNMMDEFDDEFGSNNNYYRYSGVNYNSGNNDRFIMTPYGPARYPVAMPYKPKK